MNDRALITLRHSTAPALAMHHVLINYALENLAEKRGGGATVRRSWINARAWLRGELTKNFARCE